MFWHGIWQLKIWRRVDGWARDISERVVTVVMTATDFSDALARSHLQPPRWLSSIGGKLRTCTYNPFQRANATLQQIGNERMQFAKLKSLGEWDTQLKSIELKSVWTSLNEASVTIEELQSRKNYSWILMSLLRKFKCSAGSWNPP